MCKSIRKDADSISLLHPPAGHREDLDYQEAGCEEEEKKALPDEI